ncbi:MAG: hypothetical protein SF052_18075 [Bacteroidia bacterium]|nr:hypothetical protein [Bacteroidia bacterium]
MEIQDLIAGKKLNFLSDTLNPQSLNVFLAILYSPNPCVSLPRHPNSEFEVAAFELNCPNEPYDRVYVYSSIKKLTKNHPKMLIIHLSSLGGDTLFYSKKPVADFLNSKKGYNSIEI